ncbi:MAG: hypothetical protein DRQ55_01335 [Planctomycetota bacterium]|nr:MAG: hypothetical protein DRQ55_01335 [Planctomycetota bacterium]
MPPSPEILVAMGEQGVFSMLEDVYALLEASSIRALFPDDMRASSRKSGAFFVQLLGGPALYSQRYGKPQMRQRHEPFEIDDEARAVWLACFDRVLSQAERSYGFPAEHLDGFRDFLASFSAWMLNAK